MSQNPSKPPINQTSSQINQTAGDDATQIGQVYGNVILNQFQKRPFLLYLVLFFAVMGLCICTWRIAPFIGVHNDALNSVGETICGVTQLAPNPQTPKLDPDATDTPTPTPTPEPSCIITGTNGAGLHLRLGPGTSYSTATKLPDDTTLTPIARNLNGDWIKVAQENDISGWVNTKYVTCNFDLMTLPVEEDITSLPAPIPTQEPTVVISVTPLAKGKPPEQGIWIGSTQQKKEVSFKVVGNNLYETVFDLSTSFVFDPPCSNGEVSFNSLENARISDGPSYSFKFWGMKTNNTRASLEGSFTSNTTAKGILTVNANPLDQLCPFQTVINWSATWQGR